MLPFDYILLIGLSVLVGFIASMVGVGGGFVISPLLFLLFRANPDYFGLPVLPPNEVFGYTNFARATSLFAIIFNALASSFQYSRNKWSRPRYKVGFVCALVTIPSVMIFSQLASILPTQILGIIFSVSLSLLAIKIIVWPKKSDNPAEDAAENENSSEQDLIWGLPKNRLTATIILSILAGAVSGMLGLGGGVVMVPILSQVLGLPILIAVSTSFFIMIFTSIFGTATNVMNGFVLFDIGIAIAIGYIMGSQIGTRTVKNLKSETLQQIFASIMLFGMVKIPFSTDTIESWIIVIGIWAILTAMSFGIKYYLDTRTNEPTTPETNST